MYYLNFQSRIKQDINFLGRGFICFGGYFDTWPNFSDYLYLHIKK